jgi:toxin-antitoxin system PIN domain toxin
VLVYASNTADPWHEPARGLIEHLVAGPHILYLFWPVLIGYLRTVTHPAILPRPLSAQEAMHNLATFMGPAHINVVGEAEGFWEVFTATAPEHLRGNEVPDAHLIALMRQNGVRTIHTRDRGLRRYEGIEVLELERTRTP